MKHLSIVAHNVGSDIIRHFNDGKCADSKFTVEVRGQGNWTKTLNGSSKIPGKEIIHMYVRLWIFGPAQNVIMGIAVGLILVLWL